MGVDMIPYTVEQVADTLIHVARQRGLSDMTNLKLQKLLYYAQAWNLAFTGSVLFPDDIEAWVHGPVVPKVFRRFKALGWKPIESQVTPQNDVYLSGHIKSILTAYGAFGAIQLERLTHSEDPWKIARGGLPPDVSCNTVIARKDMTQYYRARISGSR